MGRKGTETRYPGIQRLNDGSYRLRIKWRDPKTGRNKEVDRVVHGLGNPAEANRRREELRAQLEAGELEPKARTHVETYARSWLSSRLPTLKPSTAERYATALDMHILPAIGSMFMDAVERSDVQAFRDAQATKYKPNTVNGRLRVLKTLFRDATAELDLPRDPTMRVKALPVAHADEEEPNCLTAEELGRLLESVLRVCPSHYAMFRTFAETGARPGEVAALRWGDIDERMEIHIRRAHWRGHVGTTKTNHTRTLPLTPGLAQVLGEHRRRLLESQAPGLGAGWLFPSNAGTPIHGPSLREPLRAALKAAGIEGRFTLKGFRRTFNNLLRQVTTGEVVRSMTGHVTERMTEHYSHVEAREKRAAVARIFPSKGGASGGA